jgi:hypothetical protein
MVATGELALDLDNAMRSLPYASELAGVSLDGKVEASLERLSRLFDAEPAAEIWDDKALDTHRTWAEARALARELLPLVPSDGWPPGLRRDP